MKVRIELAIAPPIEAEGSVEECVEFVRQVSQPSLPADVAGVAVFRTQLEAVPSPPPAPTPYPPSLCCPECHKWFKTPAALGAHRRKHGVNGKHRSSKSRRKKA